MGHRRLPLTFESLVPSAPSVPSFAQDLVLIATMNRIKYPPLYIRQRKLPLFSTHPDSSRALERPSLLQNAI